jgi:adenylate kinase family enzyme
MDRAQLVIITGTPGAGKTTIAPLVAKRFSPSFVIDADFFWASIVNNFIEPWEPESHSQNQTMIRAALASAKRLLEGSYTVVLEGHIGPWHLHLVREELANLDCPVSYVVLRPSLDVALARSVERKNDPRHAGALDNEATIRNLYGQYQRPSDYEQNVLDSSDLGVEQTAAFIVEDMKGSRLFALAP